MHGGSRSWLFLAPLAVLGTAGLVVDIGWGVRVPSAFGVAQPQVWALAGVLPLLAVGIGLTASRPGQPVPRLLLTMGTAMAVATALGALTTRLYRSGSGGSWLWALAYAEHHLDLMGPAAMGAMFILFPDGRAQRRYERRVVTGYCAAVVLLPTLGMISSRFVIPPVYAAIGRHAIRSPLYLAPLAGLGKMAEGLVHLGAMMGIAGAGLLAVRYRRMQGRQRQQTAWLALAALAVAGDLVVVQYLGALGVIPHTAQVSAFYAAWIPALLSIPATICMALVRHQLFDIHLVIRRSLLFAAASALIGGAYVAVAAGAGITAGHGGSADVAVLATIAAVLGLQPARRRLTALADRWAYGARLGGYELLSSLGQTLAHAYDLAELAPQLARGVRDGLGLEWCRVSLCLPGADGLLEPLGAVGIGLGDQVRPVMAVPMVDGDAEVGLIEIGPAIKRDLGPEDEQLVATLARQATLAVRNAHLTAELAAQLDEIGRQAAQLEASRGRIVAAADAERRRIERNIHDGVQQQIVALMAKLRLARNQLARRPEAAESTLAEAQSEVGQTLQDLRELARGIHPPVLTDKGILAAVEARAARLPMSVHVTAPPGLAETRYDADVEGAAYFCASEALANALKHSGATNLSIEISDRDDVLEVTVADDGAGFTPHAASGTGLTGLADRVEAVGGRLSVFSRLGTGTRITAQLPARGRRTAHV